MATYFCLHVLIITLILACTGVASVVAILTWRVTRIHAAGLFLTPHLEALVHVTGWLLAKV